MYDGTDKMRELMARVRRAHEGRIPTRYVLDKLLHDGLIRDPEVLEGIDLTCVFLLREPRRTIESVVHQLDSTLDDAFNYYRERLLNLERYARAFPRSAFLTYEGLIEDPTGTLERLAGFLGLSSPLSPEYRLQPLHDMKGVGDRSGRLAAGRILSDARQISVHLPEDRVAEAEAAYLRCRSVLEQTCVVL
ncbi:MAG TPA: hypothetical protein VNM67_02310 [Thermoanaerobaculia bacterium]|nr:hypothetical protein [Thermoanaerobaculia bacterium]